MEIDGRAAVSKEEKQTRFCLVLLGFNFILFRETQSEHSVICEGKIDMDT